MMAHVEEVESFDLNQNDTENHELEALEQIDQLEKKEISEMESTININNTNERHEQLKEIEADTEFHDSEILENCEESPIIRRRGENPAPVTNPYARPTSRKSRHSSHEAENEMFTKAKRIEEVLDSVPLDLEELRQLAISKDGLVKDDLRKRAWPKLLHIDKFEFTPQPDHGTIQEHKDYNQVVLDVNRTLKRFPPGIDAEERVLLMKQLTTLIIRVLQKHPDLHYYQGYHDVAITFLLVTGQSVGFELVESLSLSHLYEFMRPNMDRTTFYLTYLYPILKRAHRPLHDHLIRSKVGTMFCLPWLITWYAHTLSDYRNVVRLYDFFLASHYLMPMYIAVAIVMHRRDKILNEECDMAMQHFVLSQVPDSLPFETILTDASSLFERFPPDQLHTEVHELIELFKEQEEKERRELLERKSKRLARPPQERSLALYLFGGRFLTGKQKTALKVLAMALAASLATGLYGYYTNSPLLAQYWSFFKRSS